MSISVRTRRKEIKDRPENADPPSCMPPRAPANVRTFVPAHCTACCRHRSARQATRTPDSTSALPGAHLPYGENTSFKLSSACHPYTYNEIHVAHGARSGMQRRRVYGLDKCDGAPCRILIRLLRFMGSGSSVASSRVPRGNLLHESPFPADRLYYNEQPLQTALQSGSSAKISASAPCDRRSSAWNELRG